MGNFNKNQKRTHMEKNQSTDHIRIECVNSITESQFQEILDLVAHRYVKSNNFWKHQGVDFDESRKFFEAYLRNSTISTLAFDTTNNDKIVGGLMGTEVVGDDYSPFLTWENTPRMEPYIEMLRHMFENSDLSR